MAPRKRQDRGSGKRRRYTRKERTAAVAAARKDGVRGAGKRLGIPPSTVHQWLQKAPSAAGVKTPSARKEAGPTRPPRNGSGKGNRFSAEVKEHALLLVASGMGRKAAATAVGTTTESVRQWVLKAEAAGTMPTPPRAPSVIAPLSLEQLTGEATGGPPESKDAGSLYAPKDPGQGLSKMETDEILKLKKKHPSYQPAQLRAQLKRFKGWRLSIKAIARVLRRNGYELVHRGSRPEGPDPIRFEAPRRNAIWQLDYMELRVPDERFHLLVVVDDFSRFCVGYAVTDSPTAETAVRLLERVIARHGKPETVRTDRGGGFLSGDFTDYLEAELIDHIVGRPYHPQGGGKVESLIGTVRRELWNVENFADRAAAERRLPEFFEEYNERRAHMGIDGLTPADRFFGRADRVLDAINAVSRQRNGAWAASERVFTEEHTSDRSGGPVEVLRLVIVGDVMELRFCGARVRLGRVEI